MRKMNSYPISSKKNIEKIRDLKGIPESVFKYFNLEKHNFDSLREKYLYFSKYSNFNDPFDCSLDLITFSKKNGRYKPQQVKNFQETKTKIEELGICCFSRTNKSILMWSHYADNHKGFCIEFETNKRLLGINPLDINYTDKFNKSQYLKQPKDSLYHLIYTKASNWKYEQELRSFDYNLFNEESRKIKFIDTDIKAIYFGVKTEKSNIELIRKIIIENYSNNISFFQGKKSNSSFEINWIELN